MKKSQWQLHGAAWMLGLVLSGCGGGSGAPAAGNTAPIALAGVVQAAVAGTTVTLDGSGSTDRDGDALTFAWTVDSTPSGDSVQLQGANTARPTFVPNQAGIYTFQLAVGDGHTASAPLSVAVDVAAPALPATPAFTLPTGGRLLDAEGSQVLYALGADDNNVALRNLATGAETTLAVSSGMDWQLSGGRVYAMAALASDPPWKRDIYRWSADGTPVNLSAATWGMPPLPSDSISHPIVRNGYIAWAGFFTVYKESDNTFQRLALVPGTAVNFVDKDLAVVDGVAHYVFSAGPDGNVLPPAFSNILHWNSATGTLERVTQNDFWEFAENPLTDGRTVAWRSLGTSSFELFARSLAGGETVQLSTTAEAYLLRDGVIAWQERRSPTQTVVMARTAAGTFTVSDQNAVLLANDGGQVIYRAGNAVSSWNAATGQRTPRVQATPDKTIVTNGAMVLTVGRAVYRLPL